MNLGFGPHKNTKSTSIFNGRVKLRPLQCTMHCSARYYDRQQAAGRYQDLQAMSCLVKFIVIVDMLYDCFYFKKSHRVISISRPANVYEVDQLSQVPLTRWQMWLRANGTLRDLASITPIGNTYAHISPAEYARTPIL